MDWLALAAGQATSSCLSLPRIDRKSSIANGRQNATKFRTILTRHPMTL